MTSPFNKLDIVSDISLRELNDYLRKTNWLDVTDIGSNVIKYQLGRNKNIRVILPKSNDYLDTHERILDTLNTLSQIEERSIHEVVADIRTLNRDALKIRLLIPEDANSIPLSEAPDHVSGIKNLWLYSACSEIRPMRHFENPYSEAIHFIDDCNFGHTFRGSYGFEVTTKVLFSQKTANMFIKPFPRRITERVARGLQFLTKAVENDSSDYLVESFESALNARMCDALIDISLNGRIVFDCDLSWATITPVSEELANFKGARISAEEVAILKDASDRLKRVEPQKETVHGYVVNLHCIKNPSDDDSRRTIEIRCRHHEHGSIEIRMDLDASRYKQAVEAHTQGQQIEVAGWLSRTGSTWKLSNIFKFDSLWISGRS